MVVPSLSLMSGNEFIQGMTRPTAEVFRARLASRYAARDGGQAQPVSFGSRHCRSKGSRQANGATSWWIWLGPHEPGL